MTAGADTGAVVPSAADAASPSFGGGGPDTSRRTLRGALANLAAHAVPILVAVLALPFLFRLLGPVRFGLLLLTWTVLDYLALADLGVARAVARFVARDLARGWLPAVRQEVALAIGVQLALGAALGAGLALAAPWVAASVLRAPPELRPEATALVQVAAAHVPLLLLLNVLRGAVEGAQRFGWVAALRTPTAVGALLLAVLLPVLGASLPQLMLGVLLFRALAAVVHAVVVRRVVPAFGWEWPRRRRLLRRLLGFGGWVAVSGLASPLLVYLERFILGAVLGPAAAGRYGIVHEGLLRLLALPLALVGVLFPRLSELAAGGAAAVRPLVGGSVRHLLLLMLPPLAAAAVLAPELLTLWIGDATSPALVTVFRVLAVGLVLNSAVFGVYLALQAAGRPDLPALAHLLELALFVPVALWLVRTYGLVGAAGAWTLRVAADAVLLAVAARRVLGLRPADGGRSELARGGALAAVLVLALLAARQLGGLVLPVAAAGVLLPLFYVAAWSLALRPDERAAVRGAVRRTRTGAA